MSRIAWVPLMEAGMKVMGLEPRTFWDLTPAELLFLCADKNAAHAPLARSSLEALIAQFPDETGTKEINDDG